MAVAAATVVPFFSGTARTEAEEASSCETAEDLASVIARARSLYGSGRLAEAEDILVRAAAATTASTSTSSTCKRGLGDTAEKNENVSTTTTLPQLLKLLGDVRVDSYKYAEAVESYSDAIALNRQGPAAPGAHFGRANAHEGIAAAAANANGELLLTPVEQRRQYELAVDDYTRCLELRPDDDDAATPTFERAQAERALGKWSAAAADYDAAAELFTRRRLKKQAKIAEAQAAFARYEAGDVATAMTRLETLSRQLYSSDVRAALVACYWRAGEAAKAEDQWLGLCEMEGASCGSYGDKSWLIGYRKWTPSLADSMADFLHLRAAAVAHPRYEVES